MIPSDRDIAAARDAMVADLVQRRIIRTPAVAAAFRTVPRHTFVPSPYAVATDPLGVDFVETTDPRRTYADAAVALQAERTVHCGAPGIVAEAIEQLAVADGMRALHIGAGAAYDTAILAQLVGERGTVVGVEHDPDLAELAASYLARDAYTTVTIRHGDGALGVPEAAPFDRILVTRGVADIASAWIEQLGDDGRLVLPFCQVGALCSLVTGGAWLSVHKIDKSLFGSFSTLGFFVPLRGTLAPTATDSAVIADGLRRWFALEDFLRAELPIRIVMKPTDEWTPQAASVPWRLETRNTVMWVEPN